MSDFTIPNFQNPVAFLLLLLLPLLVILRKLKFFTRITFPAVLADWNGNHFEWNGKSQKILSMLSRILFTSAFIISVAAFADPVYSSQEKVYTTLGTDIIFTVDISPSMSAKDMDGTQRLDAAKNAIYTLTQKNDGSRFGLVAVGSNAAVIVPPTNDRSFFSQRLSELSVGTLGNGSAIGDGLSTAVCHLVSSNAPKKCIILLTDGENNAGEIHPETAAQIAAENSISVYVVGIGTKGKVPIEYTDPVSGKLYSGYLDSNFNPAPLKKIASIGKGRYFEAESLNELAETFAAVREYETVSQNYTYRTINNLIYKQFTGLAIILFLITWFIRCVLLKEMTCFKYKKVLYVRSAFLAFGFIFMILAYSGISWGSYLSPVQKKGHSVAMVFDISNSMLATDCPEKKSRLEAASIYAKKLLSKMDNIPVSVVLAKGDGVTAIPLTDDYSMVESLMNVMSPSLMTVPGTSLGKGIQKAKLSFPTNYSAASRIWVFTDGEETDNQLTSALIECQKSGIPVTIIGFGQETESPLILNNGNTVVMTALRRAQLEKAISEAQEKFNLFSRENGLSYVNSLEKGSAVKLLSNLSLSSSENIITSYEVKPVPRYKLFLILAVISLILSYFASEFNFEKYFHKGIAKSAGLCIFLLAFTGCSSDTAEVFKGTISYHKKNYKHAIAKYISAAQIASENDDKQNLNYALYDLGTTYATLGENESALEKFDSISDDAPASVRYAAYYNAGIIAFKNSDFELAQEYFKNALQADNTRVDAKVNLELSMQQGTAKGHQNESTSIEASQNEINSKDIEKAVFEHIKENDQNQWKNSESQSDENIADDF